MSTSTGVVPISRPSTTNVRVGVLLAVVLGVLIAVYWSYEFVDDVVGGTIAELFLGSDHAADPGLIGALAFATVAGLAGTFTACNIACFASMGPLAAESASAGSGRWPLVRHAAGQLVVLALGMCLIAALYAATVIVLGDRSPMLSDASVGAVPVRLVQASVINVILGLGLVYVARRYLAARPLPGAAGTFGLGALLGLLIVGRPFPMFREVLSAAADSNPLAGIGMILLVVVGNLAIVAILYLTFVAIAGPALGRFVARNQGAVLRAGGYMLLVLAVFSLAYWGLRVPAMFGIGWFPLV